VSLDHDAIDELLAGYVLRSLTGRDAAEADRLLVDHVPDCSTCRQTLRSFQELTGELAVSVAPLQTPDLVLPRLHEELEPRRARRGPTWGAGRIAAAVAAVVVLVGVAGLAVSSSGGGNPVLANADLAQVRELQARPDAHTTSLGEADEITAPGVEETYLFGTGVSMPPPGMTYGLWEIGPSGARYLGSFTPVDGVVALEFPLDSTTVRLLVTLELAGSQPGTPGQPAWAAA
jgi:hypothetical protein